MPKVDREISIREVLPSRKAMLMRYMYASYRTLTLCLYCVTDVARYYFGRLSVG